MSITDVEPGEQTARPLDVDQLLKQMLLERPELVKALCKESVSAVATVKTPREAKAPSVDYLLTVYTGCETCHAILPVTYNMKWDGVQKCFRPQPFRCSDAVENKPLQVQLITSRTCVSCVSELSKLDHLALVDLFVKLTDPEAQIIRLVELKKALKEVGNAR